MPIPHRCPRSLPGPGIASALCAVLGLTVLAADARAQNGQVREYPPPQHYAAMNIFNAGNFQDAAKAFQQASLSGVRSTEGRWVDSVCYYAMIGECQYQMGALDQANASFEAALNLFLQHSNWMLRVDFPNLEPDRSALQPLINWGTTARNAVPARFTGRYQILTGRLDNSRVLSEGGVIALPQLNIINAHEIVRCTALAIRRRGEIMGRAAEHDLVIGRVAAALALRPAPPNHWSGAWIDLLLGLTYSAAGRQQEAAAELSKSILVANQYDHPLTATALFGLGRLAFEQEQFAVADKMFLEASLSAAWFGQESLVEESLRWGALTQMVAGVPEPYPPLRLAAPWARRGAEFLEASLLVSAAEGAAHLGQTAVASGLLTSAQRLTSRSEMRLGRVGARFQYVMALVNYQSGNLVAGDAAFAALMNFQRVSSQRLYEISLVDKLATSGAVGERVAQQLYEHALREPTARDWQVDPVETLSVVTTPHIPAIEHWFQIALARKETEKAVEISDTLRRHRFYSSLPMGGRLVALRWVLAAPEECLTDKALLQRQDLFGRHPQYAELARQAGALQAQLAKLPLVPTEEAERKAQEELLQQLGAVSTSQELMLREIALRRVPAEFVFPPALDFKALQAAWPERQLGMTFLVTSRAIHVFTFGKNDYHNWEIAGGAPLRKQIAEFLRDMGHLEKNHPLDVEQLRSEAWKTSGQALLAALTNKAPPSLWDDIDEVVIVPDGPLWYVPFEALPVGDETSSVPLLSKTRIRYAPTLALSRPDKRLNNPLAQTAVVLGQMIPREDTALGTATLGQLQSALPNVIQLQDPLAGPSGLLAALCDRLVVLTEAQADVAAAYGWSPLQLDAGKPGGDLASWMALPWGAPQQVVLPAFHTAAENGLKQNGVGDEIFLSVCGLMASGSRTILISRWRTGGHTAHELMREFVQELPYTEASHAWQRSVRLATRSELFVEREPRIKPVELDVGIPAEHPFFWSGYVLVDTGAAPSVDDKADRPAVADLKAGG